MTAKNIREFKVSPYWPLKMRPYEVQNLAFEKGRDLPRFGHWLEQGIGKTLVDFADFYHRINRDEIECNIVILPSYLKGNWETESEQYGLEWPVITWPNTPTMKQEKQPFTFVINTEAMLHSGGRWVEELIKRKGGARCMMTVDESLCIANFTTQTSKRVLLLGQQVPVHRALSGLPAPENVMQWWPQLRFCGELNGINPYSFRNRYAIMGGYMGKKITGVRNEEELNVIKDRCSIRALKRDWLDLPEKIWSPPVEFTMEGRQLEAYMSMLNEFFVEVDSGDIFANAVVHQIMKLQQVSRGFILNEGDVTELVTPDKNPALRAVASVLERIPGKTIIGCFHQHSVRMVYELMQKLDYPCVVLRGGLEKEEINERKAAFNEDGSVRVLVGQLSVTHQGHTLIGKPGKDRCSTTLFFENMYSRNVRSQMEDRNHRHGQDEPVNYIDIVENVKGSQTRKALLALQKKQDFVEATINAIRARPR